MRINWPVSLGPSGPRRPGAAQAAFTLAPMPAPADARSPGGVSAVASLGAMLAVQAVDEPAERRRQALRRGHSLLDRLEEVRRDLLDGTVPQARLQSLQLELVGGTMLDEPVLRELLAAIEQRAAVEFAKLERDRVEPPPVLERGIGGRSC